MEEKFEFVYNNKTYNVELSYTKSDLESNLEPKLWIDDRRVTHELKLYELKNILKRTKSEADRKELLNVIERYENFIKKTKEFREQICNKVQNYLNDKQKLKFLIAQGCDTGYYYCSLLFEDLTDDEKIIAQKMTEEIQKDFTNLINKYVAHENLFKFNNPDYLALTSILTENSNLITFKKLQEMNLAQKIEERNQVQYILTYDTYTFLKQIDEENKRKTRDEYKKHILSQIAKIDNIDDVINEFKTLRTEYKNSIYTFYNTSDHTFSLSYERYQQNKETVRNLAFWDKERRRWKVKDFMIETVEKNFLEFDKKYKRMRELEQLLRRAIYEKTTSAHEDIEKGLHVSTLSITPYKEIAELFAKKYYYNDVFEWYEWSENSYSY